MSGPEEIREIEGDLEGAKPSYDAGDASVNPLPETNIGGDIEEAELDADGKLITTPDEIKEVDPDFDKSTTPPEIKETPF